MKKRNLLVLGLVVTMGFSSCLKDDQFDESAQFEQEKPLLEDYATTNFDTPQLHEELGIWFDVLEEGDPDSYEYKFIQNSENPENPFVEAPEVLVKYTLTLLDKSVVEESTEEMSLGGTIYAWQYAFLPRQIDGRSVSGLTENGLKKGSHIRIATPSRWAYRNSGSNGIPPNTPLVYDIEVLDIHAPEAAE